GARSVELTREEVGESIVNGFFPRTAADELPQRRRSGIVEFGLPYPADPAITRHLAEFLNRHAEASRQALGEALDESSATNPPIPDTLLFNGGVFRAASLTQRVEDILSDWRGAPLQVLHNDTPDLAVARGAVAYALVKQGRGPKIGGGSARSYFLVLQDDAQKKTGICVLPRGTEEGHEIRLTDRVFSLRLGQPVRFHLVSSIGDAAYRAGEVVELDNDDFIRLPPIATVVPAREGGSDARKQAPVQLGASMTEVGTLEIYCVGIEEPPQRWRLEFQLRGDGAATISYDAPRLPTQFAAAIERIGLIFGSRSQQVPPKEVKQLRMQLETLLGKREHWDSALLRALFDSLWEGAKRRRRSAEHERLWFSLASYCIRPGFGYALDDWRMEKLWSLYDQGIQYGSERQNWSEWWILWRRAAGGLADAAQLRLFEALSGALQPEDAKARPSGGSAAYDDIVRLAASLERLPVARKVDIGAWLLERLKRPAENIHSWWALGRIGARAPLYGSAHTVVPVEVAVVWLEAILALDWKKVEPAAFAATQIARMTGDRLRDLPHDARCRVVARLRAINASPTWVAMVDSVVEIDEADERRAFGESLPPGLKLIEN
ncbi:MAG TPA: molecular chaperone DnaK, partial [Rhodocyclaceae bacterium]|nr:molecular chaperone DnaK [Rhodocyclaceae bacterium]